MKRIAALISLLFLCALALQLTTGQSQTAGFTDDFNDNIMDTTKWSIGAFHDANFNPSPSFAVQEIEQQLRITVPANATGYTGYVTASTWNFTNAKASVEVVQTVGLSNDTVFALGIDSGNRYRFVVEGGQLYFQYKNQNSNVTTSTSNISYSPTQHRYWRFRHSATENRMYFETSINGTDWDTRSYVTNQLNLTAIKLELDAGSFQLNGSATVAKFDNFKLETASSPTPTPTPTPTPVPTPTPPPGTGDISFSAASYSVNEATLSGQVSITVNRSNGSGLASVSYATSDAAGTTACQNNTNTATVASERCDYATSVGTLRFGVNETSKIIRIPIINDGYKEAAESFQIALSNPQGATLGSTPSATVTINSDDQYNSTFNPIDIQEFFVRQQYIDFLGRQPEDAGFNFWMNRMNNCPAGEVCDRVEVSLSFFKSDEFRERGFYVYRLYDAVLGKLPLYAEFVNDTAKLNGLQPLAEQRQSKDALLREFMNRTAFRSIYGGFLSPDLTSATNAIGFVDALCQKAGIIPASRQTLIDNLQNNTSTPAQTVEAFILAPEMSNEGTKFYDRGFITMQYFGYLRRDPEPGGFDFWVAQLIGPNAPHRQDYRFMVKGFLNSDEYHFRFAKIKALEDDDPVLPKQLVDTSHLTNTGGEIREVHDGTQLQNALRDAKPGDTIKVDPLGTYLAPEGGFKLKYHEGDNNAWIIIRSSDPAFDTNGAIAPGTRVNGTLLAHTGKMPKILSQLNNSPAISAQSGANHYRLVGLEFGFTSNVTQSTDSLVQLGTGGEETIGAMPKYIIVDRCYVHGQDTGFYLHGIGLQGKFMAVIDSYVSNFKSSQDTQAIWGSNGEGPFKIYNNYLEASGENIMFGGQDPSIDNMVPADIEIRRNLLTKNIDWRRKPGITTKNLFELKNARRVLVDGNIMENFWSGQGQDYAVNIKSSNQEGTCNWCVSEHVTFSNNVVRNVANVFDIGVKDKDCTNVQIPEDCKDPLPVNRVRIYNTLVYNVNSKWGDQNNENYGRIFLIRGGASYVKIVHVTAEGSYKIMGSDNSEEVNPYLTFKDNIVERGNYGINASGEGNPSLNFNYHPATYAKNLLVNTSDELTNIEPGQDAEDVELLSRYPRPCAQPNITCGGDTFVASTWANVGFTDRANGDYRLLATSIYKNKASDGTDLGANLDFIIDGLGKPIPPSLIISDPGSGFSDDFNDNARDTVKWNLGVLNEPSTSLDTLVTVLEQNQRLEITPRNGLSGKRYHGYVSAATWDMTNARAGVEVIQKTASSADTIFAIGIDSNNWFRFITEDNQLYFQEKVAGTKTGSSVAYSSTQHKFWRFRSNGAANQIIFETSPDGATWTVRRTVTVQFSITAMRMELSAGTFAAQYSPGKAIFDNFRLER